MRIDSLCADWWTTACAVHRGAVKFDGAPKQPTRSRLMVGEWRAHTELARKFNVTLKCVAGPCRGPFEAFFRCDIHNMNGPIFLVESIGTSQADDGVGALYDSPKLQNQILNHWPLCMYLGERHIVKPSE